MTPGLPFGPHQKVEKRLPQGNYSTGKECFFHKPEENPTSRSVLPPQPPAPSSACEFGTQVQARATQSNPTSHSPFRRPAARRKRTSSSAPLYCKFYRGRAQRWSGVTCDHRSTSEVQCEDSGSARPLSFTLCPRASQTLQTWMPKNTFQALKVAWHVCIHNLQVQGKGIWWRNASFSLEDSSKGCTICGSAQVLNKIKTHLLPVVHFSRMHCCLDFPSFVASVSTLHHHSLESPPRNKLSARRPTGQALLLGRNLGEEKLESRDTFMPFLPCNISGNKGS